MPIFGYFVGVRFIEPVEEVSSGRINATPTLYYSTVSIGERKKKKGEDSVEWKPMIAE